MKSERAKRAKRWKRIKRAVFQRDAVIICHVCKQPMKWKDYTVDHLVRRRDGGSDELDNLAPAHGKCNTERD